ncbi:MAG: hypothetical protein EPGJADBJ_01524 [Saprospiraceae bacterium]|nr:hypothetical protein [Saprospiraceae bacterium]
MHGRLEIVRSDFRSIYNNHLKVVFFSRYNIVPMNCYKIISAGSALLMIKTRSMGDLMYDLFKTAAGVIQIYGLFARNDKIASPCAASGRRLKPDSVKFAFMWFE